MALSSSTVLVPALAITSSIDGHGPHELLELEEEDETLLWLDSELLDELEPGDPLDDELLLDPEEEELLEEGELLLDRDDEDDQLLLLCRLLWFDDELLELDEDAIR